MAGISIAGVTKRFGAVTALGGVSLDVASGEFIALVGPSGCGKTTLMRIVAGIEGADDGSIAVGGRDVTRLRAAERDIAMVFQSYALYPHLTVAQNIAVPLAMRRLSGADRLPLVGRFWPGGAARRTSIVRDVAVVADSLGLGGLLDRRPGQLSGGQRQRVALARAIIRRPAAFLMDEPLSNLDAALRVQTRREIVDIHRRAGVATLYVTHDQTEALTMADRVAVMMAGEILQVATPEAIYADPQDLRVARFIGSPRINTLPAEGGATLALRPEDLRIAEHGIPAVAEAVEFLGDSVLLHARHASGNALILRLPPEAPRPREGAALHLAYDPARALFFDTNGRRIPAPRHALAHALV